MSTHPVNAATLLCPVWLLNAALAREAGLRIQVDLLLEQQRQADRMDKTECLPHLTHRQREVLDLILEGRPNKIIADDLGISQRTVENHRAEIMHRTHSKSLCGLVQTVMAAGWHSASTKSAPT